MQPLSCAAAYLIIVINPLVLSHLDELGIECDPGYGCERAYGTYCYVISWNVIIFGCEPATPCCSVVWINHDHLLLTPHTAKPRPDTVLVIRVLLLLQSGDWVVLLEGLCRIAIDSSQQNHGEAFDSANITQLELRPGSSPNQPPTGYSHSPHATASTATHATAATGSGSSSSDSAQQLVDLGKQLKVSTGQLLKLLSQQTGLTSVVRRLMDLLESVPPWRAADVVAAALGMTPQVGGGGGKMVGGYVLDAG